MSKLAYVCALRKILHAWCYPHFDGFPDFDQWSGVEYMEPLEQREIECK
jgi:hypothetical protein